MNKYIPGVCNIGAKERLFRRRSGYLAVVLGILLVIILISSGAPNYYRLVLFLPAFTAAISFLQDLLHFCAEFAILGVYNFEDKIGRKINITEKEFLKKDRIKALQIVLYSFFIASSVTLVFFLLP